jgi:hypothetical protein
LHAQRQAARHGDNHGDIVQDTVGPVQVQHARHSKSNPQRTQINFAPWPQASLPKVIGC